MTPSSVLFRTFAMRFTNQQLFNMRNLKNLLLTGAVALLFSCSLSAKDENDSPVKNETTAVSAQKGEVVVLTKADFLTKVFNYEKNPSEWVYEGDKPCIIDFYADWCGPCRMVAPILKDLAKQYQEDLIIYKINVDKEQELAAVFGVRSIPTILFVPQKGKPMLSQGALPKEEFVKQINEFLLKK